MTISEQLDKASDQLKGLSEKASAAEANAKAAMEQRVAAAETSAKQASDNMKASAKDARDDITQWWGEVQDNWKSLIARVRRDTDEDKANLKADRAEKRAERAEAHAANAVEFANAAIEEAEYQVLNAALARLDAEDAAAAT